MVAFTCPNKGQLIIKKLNGFFALFVQFFYKINNA